MDRELAAFFSEMFELDVKRGDLANVNFPTFEEVLGLTDLAIMRKDFGTSTSRIATETADA